MRTIGTRDVGAIGFNSTTNGDFVATMVASTGGQAIAGDGTTAVVTEPKAARITTAPPATIEPLTSSSTRADTKSVRRYPLALVNSDHRMAVANSYEHGTPRIALMSKRV